MFHPLRLTSDEAWQFLKSVEDIEKCGIVCRVPNWWKRGASAVSLSVRLGGEKPSLLGFESIVSSQPSLSVDGVPLSGEEIGELLQSTEGLAFLKGRWVEVNHDMLQRSFGCSDPSALWPLEGREMTSRCLGPSATQDVKDCADAICPSAEEDGIWQYCRAQHRSISSEIKKQLCDPIVPDRTAVSHFCRFSAFSFFSAFSTPIAS